MKFVSIYLAIVALGFLVSYSAFGNSCEKEVAVQCPAGYVDGCTVKDESTENKLLTTHHVCVWENSLESAKNGISCVREMAILCRVAHQDACLLNSGVAENHICVLK